jgi:DNA mismatch endonuclease (patch repair protein)
MMAAITSEARSRIMSAIRKRDTKPELAVRRFLHAKGLRYRLHGAHLPGCPDLVLPSRGAVVFVHGCFWHRCSHCPAGRKVVRSNVDYWRPKLERNVARDARVKQELEGLGWVVLTIWECQTGDPRDLNKMADTLLAAHATITRSKAYPTAQRRRGSRSSKDDAPRGDDAARVRINHSGPAMAATSC